MKVWQQLEGILEQVDLLNRTAQIRKDHRCLTFDLPPACDILLRGERVKLRMLQPLDRVTVRYRSAAGRHVASLIEVLATTASEVQAA
ncbi:MAG TPA: hypothetical protein VGN42_09920 [Pirellulales bacterium]|jgi:hypothetical protein|nr:hypothetical protein [Pirellulales bacterium]